MAVDPGFEELYRAEYVTVFRAVYVLCGDRGTAEEATQEAFARALARWTRLRDRPWAGGWVTSTALNAARRALRRRHAPPDSTELSEEGPEESMDLWAAIRRLPRRQREAVILHYVADRPLREVAALMGCREGTTKAHLSKARNALRQTWGGQGDG